MQLLAMVLPLASENAKLIVAGVLSALLLVICRFAYTYATDGDMCCRGRMQPIEHAADDEEDDGSDADGAAGLDIEYGGGGSGSESYDDDDGGGVEMEEPEPARLPTIKAFVALGREVHSVILPLKGIRSWGALSQAIHESCEEHDLPDLPVNGIMHIVLNVNGKTVPVTGTTPLDELWRARAIKVSITDEKAN
jgi:hypothetical protein